MVVEDLSGFQNLTGLTLLSPEFIADKFIRFYYN